VVLLFLGTVIYNDFKYKDLDCEVLNELIETRDNANFDLLI